MQIKTLVQRCVVSGVLFGSMVWSGTLAAGEAIQFSSDKTKPVAASENPLTKDRLTPKSKLSGTSPLDSAGVGVMRNDSRRRLDPKEERRLDNKQLEDENWMILNEGELQAQDDRDEVYGPADFDSDRKRTSGDIWFTTKQGDTARGSGTARSRNSILRTPGQSRPQDGGAPDEDKDTSFGFAKRLGREADVKSDRSLAMDSGAQGAAAPNVTDSALKDLFNPGSTSARGSDDRGRDRSELGLRSFDTSGGRASSLGSSFGFGQSAAGATSMKELGFKPAASSATFSPPGAGRLGGSGMSDAFSSRPISGIGPAMPQQSQAPGDTSPRSTRGTFDLPSRPGFGR